MAFPQTPTNGDYHYEGSSSFFYKDGIWIKLAEEQRVATIVQSLLTEAQFQADMTDEYKGQWVLADGRSVAGSKFANITGLNEVPDLRAAYLRMAGQNTNSEWNGGTLKSYQEDNTRRPRNTALTTSQAGSHYHSLGWFDQDVSDFIQQYSNINAANATVGVNSPQNKVEDAYDGGNSAEGTTSERLAASSTDGNHSHTINGGGDTETRPKTYAVNYFIKIN